MPVKSIDRRSRYERILLSLVDRHEFTVTDIKTACFEERPAFITSLLNQLADDSILQVHDAGKNRTYRWATDRANFSCQAWIDRRLRGVQMTQTPETERPRERLLRLGADKLRTAELLAILIRTGRTGESALQAGEKIANHCGEDIDRLRTMSPVEIKYISKAISEPAFCQIMAGVELGRRVAESIHRDDGPPQRIDSSMVAVAYCKKHFARLAYDRRQEEFHIVTLDTKLHPIGHHQITVGTLDASLVSPREVFRAAIRDAAAAVLLVHNHPSGDPTPSRQDFQVTDSLDSAGKIIGIQVVDHVVVAANGCVSIRDLR